MQRFSLPLAFREFSFNSSRFDCIRLTQAKCRKKIVMNRKQVFRITGSIVKFENFSLKTNSAWILAVLETHFAELNSRKLPEFRRFRRKWSENTLHLADTYFYDCYKLVAFALRSCKNQSDQTPRFYRNFQHLCGSHQRNERQSHPIYYLVNWLRKMVMLGPSLQNLKQSILTIDRCMFLPVIRCNFRPFVLNIRLLTKLMKCAPKLKPMPWISFERNVDGRFFSSFISKSAVHLAANFVFITAAG